MKAVLDSWAVTALLDGDVAAPTVDRIVREREAWMSSINLGEVYYVMVRRQGRRVASDLIDEVRKIVQVDHPDWPLVRDAAQIKAAGGLSYADAFCVATARRHQVPLYTGDPEIIKLHGDDLDVVDLRAAA